MKTIVRGFLEYDSATALDGHNALLDSNGGFGLVVTSIQLQLTDGTPRSLYFGVSIGGVAKPFGPVITVPASTGWDGLSRPLSIVNESWLPGLPLVGGMYPGIPLPEGQNLVVSLKTSLSATTFLRVTAIGFLLGDAG
jgi:hypothetical protein